MNRPLRALTPEELTATSTKTLGHYQRLADEFLQGTRDHDVSQNIEALLRNIDGGGPYDILDFGCGPGRDLLTLRQLGHRPVGIDECLAFVEMAENLSDCKVWHQDFLNLRLPDNAFDGIFANASFSMSQRRSSIAYCENSMTASDPAGCSSVRIRADPILSATMESDTAVSSKRQHGVPSFSTQVSPSWNITTGPQTNHESGSPGWRHCGENRIIRSPSPRP